MSLLTDMDVFPFLFGNANDRECGTFEGKRQILRLG